MDTYSLIGCIGLEKQLNQVISKRYTIIFSGNGALAIET